jgi:hypothetical protein
LADVDRYKISVRGTRAYLAGFGTSGSLLAGAAVLFLIASAIVAFRGWPQIGTGPVTSDVAATPVAVTSRAARRLTVAIAVTRQRVIARGGTAAVRGGVGAHRVALKGVRTGGPLGGQGTGSASAGSGAAGGSPGAGAGQCDGCRSPSPQNPIGTLTNKIAQTVSTVGTNVGQQITGLSGAASGGVSSASPQLGSAVGSAGAGAGSAVGSTSNSVANAVTTAGNVLGGGGH